MLLDVRSRLALKFEGKFAQNFHGAVAGLKILSSKPLGHFLKSELFSDLMIIAGSKLADVQSSQMCSCKRQQSVQLEFIYEGHIPFRQMKNTLICCDLFDM